MAAVAIQNQTTPLHKKQHLFVGDEEFERIMTLKYQRSVPCSEQEIRKIEEIFQVSSLRAEEYVVGFDRSCKKCQKQLTFYDVLLQGIKAHSIHFMKAAIFGRKMVGRFPPGTQHQLQCSGCGSVTVIANCDNFYKCENYVCG